MFFRKRRKEISYSLQRIAWGKFKKNKLSMAGLIFIILAFIVSISGYLLTPDTTPNCNRQILELATKKPGFTVDMLLVRKNIPSERKNFFRRMFTGEQSPYNFIPLNSWYFDGDKVIAEEFNELEEEKFLSEWDIADVVFPLQYGQESQSKGNTITFTDIYENQHTINIPDLYETISNEHIKRYRFILGTDRFGRDMLSRLLIGTRISLSVGFISVFISLLIGITLGALAGYFRGVTDNIIMWLINVIWSIPTLLMVIAITLVLGKGFWQIFIAVGLTMWVEVARVVRGQVLSLREKEYVEAGRALGFSDIRILFHHILPNAMSPVIIISAANFSSAILIEAGLSFLGIGVQPPVSSWGSMIRDHYGYIIVDLAYLAVTPGIAIMLLVLSITIVGNGLRDALDTRSVG